MSITLGALPAGWARSRQSRGAGYAAGIIGAFLVAPFVALVVAALLRATGLDAPYSWISSTPAAILAASLRCSSGFRSPL